MWPHPTAKGQPVHSPGVGGVVDLTGRRPADGRLARENVLVNAPRRGPPQTGGQRGLVSNEKTQSPRPPAWREAAGLRSITTATEGATVGL